MRTHVWYDVTAIIIYFYPPYIIFFLLSGDGENPAISEQSTDGGDYLSTQETTKVDMYPQTVDLDAVPGEPTLTSESTELGGAGGGVWDQYNGEGITLNCTESWVTLSRTQAFLHSLHVPQGVANFLRALVLNISVDRPKNAVFVPANVSQMQV